MESDSNSSQRDSLLYLVAAEITSSLDLDEVLSRVMDRVLELMKATRGFVVLVDPFTRELEVRMARGADAESLNKEFLGSSTIIHKVVNEGIPVLATDASSDDRFKGHQSVILHNLRSIIAVPLTVKGKVIGALYVDNPFKAGIFRDTDKDFFKAIADLAAIAIDNAITYRNAENLRHTFERYVNKSVTDWVLQDPNRDQVFLPGQRLHVTMLNTDIAGFSTLSQTMEAEEMVDFLNRYFGRMVEVVLHHGGNIDKFLGDGMLVAFGAPEPMHDSAKRAVAAAKGMWAELKVFNAELLSKGSRPITVGMGIDTGYIVAGNIGSERRIEYTMIGVPVNNSAYLAKLRPARILISQATLDAAGDVTNTIRLEPMILKGASTAIPIYSVE